MSGVEVHDELWRELLAKAHGLDKMHVRVGVLAGGEEHDAGREEGGEGIGMMELAAIQHFGSPAAGIPARPWIDAPFKAEPAKLGEMCAKLCKAIVTDRMTVARAYALLGAWCKKEIQLYVTSGPHIPPPLASLTVIRKGSDRPLVNTGRMVNAVDYEVAEGPAA